MGGDGDAGCLCRDDCVGRGGCLVGCFRGAGGGAPSLRSEPLHAGEKAERYIVAVQLVGRPCGTGTVATHAWSTRYRQRLAPRGCRAIVWAAAREGLETAPLLRDLPCWSSATAARWLRLWSGALPLLRQYLLVGVHDCGRNLKPRRFPRLRGEGRPLRFARGHSQRLRCGFAASAFGTARRCSIHPLLVLDAPLPRPPSTDRRAWHLRRARYGCRRARYGCRCARYGCRCARYGCRCARYGCRRARYGCRRARHTRANRRQDRRGVSPQRGTPGLDHVAHIGLPAQRIARHVPLVQQQPHDLGRGTQRLARGKEIRGRRLNHLNRAPGMYQRPRERTRPPAGEISDVWPGLLLRARRGLRAGGRAVDVRIKPGERHHLDRDHETKQPLGDASAHRIAHARRSEPAGERISHGRVARRHIVMGQRRPQRARQVGAVGDTRWLPHERQCPRVRTDDGGGRAAAGARIRGRVRVDRRRTSCSAEMALPLPSAGQTDRTRQGRQHEASEGTHAGGGRRGRRRGGLHWSKAGMRQVRP